MSSTHTCVRTDLLSSAIRGATAGEQPLDPRTVDLSSEAVTVPAGAGDLVIWRHEIPHGASANRSDRPRLAHYVNHYPMHWPDERPWL